MEKPLKNAAQKVQDAVNALGFDFRITQFKETTRTSADAAAAIGCTLGQIAKSLVFRAKQSNTAVLIITSGSNRVNEKMIKEILGENISRADADFVREQTGFAIGGIPPVGHNQKLTTLIDEDLLQYEEIWAAAGTPNAVFRLTPPQLVELTGGQVAKVT